jgi:hypothetical protein
MIYSCFGKNYIVNIVTCLSEGNKVSFSSDADFHETLVALQQIAKLAASYGNEYLFIVLNKRKC